MQTTKQSTNRWYQELSAFGFGLCMMLLTAGYGYILSLEHPHYITRLVISGVVLGCLAVILSGIGAQSIHHADPTRSINSFVQFKKAEAYWTIVFLVFIALLFGVFNLVVAL